MTENMKEILELIPLCLSCFAFGFATCNLSWVNKRFSSSSKSHDDIDDDGDDGDTNSDP